MKTPVQFPHRPRQMKAVHSMEDHLLQRRDARGMFPTAQSTVEIGLVTVNLKDVKWNLPPSEPLRRSPGMSLHQT